jgi:hypothetical protein
MKKGKILVHIAGCVMFLALPIVFSPDASSVADLWKYPPALKDFLVYLALLLFFYFNFFWLIPTFYFRRKYISFTLITLVCFGLIVLLPNALIGRRDFPPSDEAFHPMAPVPMPDVTALPEGQMRHPPPPPRARHNEHTLLLDVSHQVFLFLAVFFFSLILRINLRWKQTEKEKLHAELSYLKAQINPHFLFNTLNSIYSLAIEKSDQTPSAVVKLSGMMRYVISDAGHELVPLQRELEYIRSYIELQQLRFGDTVPVAFNLHGEFANQRIAPLILISFVENAFKYGVNASEHSDISISISVANNQLEFTAFNKKVTVHQDNSGGLGIENTRQRLQLVYPGRHTLEIKNTPEDFTVTLLLQLT